MVATMIILLFLTVWREVLQSSTPPTVKPYLPVHFTLPTALCMGAGGWWPQGPS